MTVSYSRLRRVRSNTSLPAASTLMLMASRPASIMPRAISSVMSEPLLIMPDFGDALRLRVAHLLDELLVEERLAVVVHAHVRDAERGALVDDLREQIDVHDALPAVHLVARAEHALGVAEVRALDLDDVGQPRRAVAPGRRAGACGPAWRWPSEQPLGGCARACVVRATLDRLSPMRRLERRARGVRRSTRAQNLVERQRRLVADERVDLRAGPARGAACPRSRPRRPAS